MDLVESHQYADPRQAATSTTLVPRDSSDIDKARKALSDGGGANRGSLNLRPNKCLEPWLHLRRVCWPAGRENKASKSSFPPILLCTTPPL